MKPVRRNGARNPTEIDTIDTSYICVTLEKPRISEALRGESDRIALWENKNVLTNVGNYLARRTGRRAGCEVDENAAVKHSGRVP